MEYLLVIELSVVLTGSKDVFTNSWWVDETTPSPICCQPGIDIVVVAMGDPVAVQNCTDIFAIFDVSLFL